MEEENNDNPLGLRRNPVRQARGRNKQPDFVYSAVDMDDQFLLFHLNYAELTKAMSSVSRCMHYLSVLSMDHGSDEINYTHPFAFAIKTSDADTPTWDEAMQSDDRDAF